MIYSQSRTYTIHIKVNCAIFLLQAMHENFESIYIFFGIYCILTRFGRDLGTKILKNPNFFLSLTPTNILLCVQFKIEFPFILFILIILFMIMLIIVKNF